MKLLVILFIASIFFDRLLFSQKNSISNIWQGPEYLTGSWMCLWIQKIFHVQISFCIKLDYKYKWMHLKWRLKTSAFSIFVFSFNIAFFHFYFLIYIYLVGSNFHSNNFIRWNFSSVRQYFVTFNQQNFNR